LGLKTTQENSRDILASLDLDMRRGG
jgi:hypothetical protein